MKELDVPALDTRIADTLMAYGDQHENPDEFVSGRCAELALATCMLGSDLRLPTELTIIMREEYEDDGKLFCTIFSHCIANVNGSLCDIEGADADERWTSKWPWPPEPCEHGLTSEFTYINIAYSKDSHEEAVATLSKLCEANTVPFDIMAIKVLHKELKAILHDNRKDYQHLIAETDLTNIPEYQHAS